MIPIAAIGQGIQIGGSVISVLGQTFGAKPHDMCPELPSDMNTRVDGISNDPSWPLYNTFAQDKALDGGTSWNCDNKKTWIWIYTNPSGPFSIEDTGPARLQNFVNRLQSLYQAGKIPRNYDVGAAYREKVVIGRDLTFKFLDDIESGKTVLTGSTALAGFDLSGGSGMLTLVGVLVIGTILLIGKK